MPVLRTSHLEGQEEDLVLLRKLRDVTKQRLQASKARTSTIIHTQYQQQTCCIADTENSLKTPMLLAVWLVVKIHFSSHQEGIDWLLTYRESDPQRFVFRSNSIWAIVILDVLSPLWCAVALHACVCLQGTASPSGQPPVKEVSVLNLTATLWKDLKGVRPTSHTNYQNESFKDPKKVDVRNKVHEKPEKRKWSLRCSLSLSLPLDLDSDQWLIP